MLLSEIKILKENVQLPEDVVAFIHEHCQQYLQAVGGDLQNFLYRGVSDNAINRASRLPNVANSYIVPGHYDNRRPLNTEPVIHDAANRLFIKHFGAPFRNGVCATGDQRVTVNFGSNRCILIPIGDFKFCWSKRINDFTEDYEAHAGNFELEVWEEGFPSPEDIIEDLERNLAKDYQITDLRSGILSNNEVMLYCDKCLMYIPG